MNQIVVAQFAGRRRPEWPSSLMLPGSPLLTGNEADIGGIATVDDSPTSVGRPFGSNLHDGIFDHSIDDR